MKQQEFTAGLSITERCNLKCGHCYIGQKDLWKDLDYNVKEISLQQIKKMVPKLVEANVKRINLGGGETPLHRDFIDIVEELHKAGMIVSLTTNGSTFPVYRNHLHLFNDIGVSIDFPDERHSEFRGNKKVFDRAIGTLQKLVESGVRTELVTCIMSINYQELPAIFEIAQDIGVDMWRLNRFHSSKNDQERFQDKKGIESKICHINESLSCTPEQMKQTFEYLASLTPDKQNYVIPDSLFRVYVGGKGVTSGSPYGKIAFRIKTNGDITPNVFTDDVAGNIFRDDMDTILTDNSFMKYQNLTPSGKCVNCTNYEACEGGDITDSYLLNGDLNSTDPFCFLDPNEKRETVIVGINETKFVHETYLGTIYIPVNLKNG